MKRCGQTSYGKAALRMLGSLLLCYGLVCAAMFFLQRKLQYFPDAAPFDAAAFGGTAFEPIDVHWHKTLVRSWHRPALSGQPTVVFMHGNAGSFAGRVFRIHSWLQAGFGVALASYPGFEGNAGSPSENGNYASARGVMRALLKRGVPPDKIILLGESLGSGIAVQMATEFAVGGLVLESPYTSMADAAAYHYPFLPVRWLLWDKYDSIGKIKNVKAPLLIIHGEADQVVPASQGRALFAAAHEPKEALFLPLAGHGGGLYADEINQRILDFIRRRAP